MDKERGIKITNVNNDTDKNDPVNDTLNDAVNIIIGNLCGQTIAGTTFKYEILEDKGTLFGKRYVIVRNIETEHRMLICVDELYKL